MMNLATVVAGSVEVPAIDANNAQNVDTREDSACTVRVTATDPHSVSSRDLPYPHPDNAPSWKHSVTKITSRHGAASAYATTQDTKRWIVPPGSSAIAADDKGTSIS